MITAPYVPGRLYDEFFPRVIAGLRRSLSDDDDALVVCFGTAGTGKTSLMFHGYSEFSREPRLSQVALTRRDLAQALFNVGSLPIGERFVAYDEANVSRRETMTSWNRDLIDLYFSIRGKNVFNWWNNPSLDYLDRVFIEERVKMFVFCFSKGRTIRKYRLFSKDGMLRMLDKEGDLKLYTIKKRGERYAYYEGWFKRYDGPLWGVYLDKKEGRMDEKLTDFHRKYGMGESQALSTVAERLGVNDHTVKKAVMFGAREGLLKSGDDYAKRGSRWLLTESGASKLQDIIAKKLYSKRIKATGSENTPAAGHNIYSRDDGAGGAA